MIFKLHLYLLSLTVSSVALRCWAVLVSVRTPVPTPCGATEAPTHVHPSEGSPTMAVPRQASLVTGRGQVTSEGTGGPGRVVGDQSGEPRQPPTPSGLCDRVGPAGGRKAGRRAAAHGEECETPVCLGSPWRPGPVCSSPEVTVRLLSDHSDPGSRLPGSGSLMRKRLRLRLSSPGWNGGLNVFLEMFVL